MFPSRPLGKLSSSLDTTTAAAASTTKSNKSSSLSSSVCFIFHFLVFSIFFIRLTRPLPSHHHRYHSNNSLSLRLIRLFSSRRTLRSNKVPPLIITKDQPRPTAKGYQGPLVRVTNVHCSWLPSPTADGYQASTTVVGSRRFIFCASSPLIPAGGNPFPCHWSHRIRLSFKRMILWSCLGCHTNMTHHFRELF